MIKLRKYLKPFVFSIIFTICFLLVQANCELSLPDYMSKIVNYGIQNGGIENNIPNVIREDEYEKVKFFLDEKDQKDLNKLYTKVTKKSSDYNEYKEEYPILKKENVFVLKDDADKDIIEKLDTAVGKSEIIVSSIDNPEKIKDQNLFSLDTDSDKMKQMQQMQGMTSGKTDTFTMIKNMPEKNLNEFKDKIYTSLDKIPETSISQVAGTFIKSEYKAVGLNLEDVQSSYIFNIGIKMLLIALLSAVCAICVGFLASRAGAGVAKALRKDVFGKVESFSNAEFNKFAVSSLITRTTNDINQVQMLITMGMRMICFAPIMGAIAIFKALEFSASMSWIILLAVILILGFMMIAFSVVLPRFKIVQKLTDKLNLVVRENLSGLMVIRAFGTEDFEEERFDETNKSLTKTNLFVNRFMMFLFPFMMIVMNLVQLLIVWVGANQIEASALQVGDMMAFIQYAMQIIMSFLMISMMFIMVPRASVSANRINEVLETEVELKDPKEEKEFDENKIGVVEFKDVSFAYPGASEYVLHHINFTANKGETTAIVGSTGSGKSTLIQLIPRLFEASKGEILVDGVNVKDINQDHLRDKVGYIPQQGILFKGTIKSNLQYGKQNATDEEMRRACDIAQASEFINEKPEGFETEISSGGTNVSGGQRQRLSIARAIIKNAEIYIFDDSFSALDFKTDKNLRAALNKELSNATMIIVAQRISTIMHAEKIIVLDEGEIAGIGTHKELMENCDVYKEIALSQLSEEEVRDNE